MLKNLLLSIILLNLSLSAGNLFEEINFDMMSVKMNATDVYSENLSIAVGENGYVRIIINSGDEYEFYQIDENLTLNDVVFVNENIFTIGSKGKIFKSFDGKNWEEVDSPTENNLNSILFFGDNYGIIVGDKGTILISSDSGENWELSEVENTGNFNSVTVGSNNLLYVAGDNATLLKSSDLGKSWNNLTTNQLVNFRKVIAKNDDKLFVAGDSLTVLVSDDAGSSFFEISLDIKNLNEFVKPEINMHFFDADTGFVKVRDLYSNFPMKLEYYTDNGGKNWRRYNPDDEMFVQFADSPNCFDFLDKSYGYFIEDNGADYSAKYNPVRILYSSITRILTKNIIEIKSKTETDIFLVYSVGSPFRLIYSSDAGKSWAQKPTIDTIGKSRGQVRFSDLYFAGEHSIICAMGNRKDSSYINEDSNKVTIIKHYGFTIKSDDMGQTWKEFVIPGKESIQNISMLNEKSGLMALNYNKYMYTENGGETWEYGNVLPDGTTKYLRNCFYPSEEHFILLGINEEDKNIIIESYDKGVTWETPIPLPDNTHILKLYNEKFFAVSYEVHDNNDLSFTIWEYDNNDWISIYTSDVASKRDLKFFHINNPNDMIGIDYENNIYYTFDRWKTVNIIQENPLSNYNYFTKLEKLAQNIYIIASNRGHMYKLLIDPETGVNFEEISKSSLFISPNPASDYIEISLGSHSSSNGACPIVSRGEIAIYDMLGEKVLTESTHPMTPIHRMNVSNLPAGFYFVRLKGLDKVYYKKLVIRR